MNERVNQMLPIVADSWDRLRPVDVERLLDQFGDEWPEAGRIIVANRPDLEKRVEMYIPE